MVCELMDLRAFFEVRRGSSQKVSPGIPLTGGYLLSPVFQTVPHARFSAARCVCNLYEALSKPGLNPFVNRSALKLADLDHLTEVSG